MMQFVRLLVMEMLSLMVRSILINNAHNDASTGLGASNTTSDYRLKKMLNVRCLGRFIATTPTCK